MSLTEKNLQDSHTRERLLDAAEYVFARKGFTAASIREITEKANSNLASVNYYFHSKEGLYTEVLRRSMRLLAIERIDILERMLYSEQPHINLESVIRSFVEIFIEPFAQDGSGTHLMRLMIRERYDQHLPNGLFLNEVVRPIRNAVRQALLKVCPELNPVDADLCFHSIVAQLLNLIQAQDFFRGVDEEYMPLLDMNKSTKHIAEFSIGGIRQYLQKSAE